MRKEPEWKVFKKTKRYFVSYSCIINNEYCFGNATFRGKSIDSTITDIENHLMKSYNSKGLIILYFREI